MQRTNERTKIDFCTELFDDRSNAKQGKDDLLFFACARWVQWRIPTCTCNLEIDTVRTVDLQSVHTNKHIIHSGAEVSICLFSNKGFHANKILISSQNKHHAQNSNKHIKYAYWCARTVLPFPSTTPLQCAACFFVRCLQQHAARRARRRAASTQ